MAGTCVLMLSALSVVAALKLAVTGAGGYLGAEIACAAEEQGHEVRAVLRPNHSTKHLPSSAEIVVVEDLTDMVCAREVAHGMDAVIHAASVFRKCDDMEEGLVVPNIALAEAMACACAASNCRLVLTSSMAAVRGSGQAPRRPPAYTIEDWNCVSARDGPGFEPYQFSKTESERRAWAIAKEVGLEMVSLCPSMIFGPPRSREVAGLSVNMVEQWIAGVSPVQSRLVVDVRDAALAHIAAATLEAAANKRFIVSEEARVPACEAADAIRTCLRDHGRDEQAQAIFADEAFDGGAISIGDQEVVATAALAELGVACRPSTETLTDMTKALLAQESESR